MHTKIPPVSNNTKPCSQFVVVGSVAAPRHTFRSVMLNWPHIIDLSWTDSWFEVMWDMQEGGIVPCNHHGMAVVIISVVVCPHHIPLRQH